MSTATIATIVENDDGADFLYELQPHHNLVVIVEMCQAQRPSKLGSLKGSHAKYEEEFSRLEATMSTLAGNGSVEHRFPQNAVCPWNYDKTQVVCCKQPANDEPRFRRMWWYSIWKCYSLQVWHVTICR